MILTFFSENCIDAIVFLLEYLTFYRTKYYNFISVVSILLICQKTAKAFIFFVTAVKALKNDSMECSKDTP